MKLTIIPKLIKSLDDLTVTQGTELRGYCCASGLKQGDELCDTLDLT